MAQGKRYRGKKDNAAAAEERKRKAAEEEQRRLEEEEAERLRIEEEERLALEAAEAERRRLEAEEAEQRRVAETRGVLREKNSTANSERPALGKLKADIKKCSAFVKKLQKISLDTKDALIREFESINLSRYISEAVDNLCETKLKVADVFACVEVCSVFHQRYADFSALLIPQLLKQCAPPADSEEMSATVMRRRTLLRWLVELVVCGIFTERMQLIRLFADTVKADLEDPEKQFINLPIIVAFGKAFGYLFLPHAEKLLASAPMGPVEGVFDPKERDVLNKGMNKLFTSIVDSLQQVNQTLTKQEEANCKMMQRGGELNIEALSEYQELRASRDGLASLANSVAQILDTQVPEFEPEAAPAEEQEEDDASAAEADSEELKAESEVIWDDGEIRSFYSLLPELRALVPEVMFLDNAGDLDSTEDSGVFKALLAEFLGCESKETIDNWTIKFCRHNKQQHRERLVEHIVDSAAPHKMHNMPYCARGIAALSLKGLLVDIGPVVVERLKTQFITTHANKRWSSQDKHQMGFVIRFLSELVNFRVAAPEVMFELLRTCVDDFDRSIELACGALDICGHFLYRNSASKEVISSLVELMFKTKNSKNASKELSTMVDNAYNTCKPPVLVNRELSCKPPLQQYIERLLFVDIGSKMSADKVEKQLRKLPWAETEGFLVSCFTNARKLKFNHIEQVAQVVSKLSRQYEDFGILVADQVLEDVRFGMELNKWEHMQSRITTIKFLGELYVWRLVDHQTIFDTLNLLITLGYTGSRASQAAQEPLEDFTRVRLVCTLLDSVGATFLRGNTKKRLDGYLKYFQRYYLSKPSPPVDVVFGVGDLFESLRPKWTLYESYEQACKDITEMEQLEQKSAHIKGKLNNREMRVSGARPALAMETIEEDEDAAEEQPEEDAAEEDEEDDEEEDASDGAEGEASEESEEEQEQNAVDLEDDAQMFYRDVRAVREMEDDFDREFRMMMLESVTDRKSKNAAPAFCDVGVPFSFERAKPKVLARPSEEDEDEDEELKPSMQFQMLTRKGPKGVKASSLQVPLECSFAAKTLANEQAERRERAELTAKVLAYEDHESRVAQQEALSNSRVFTRHGQSKNQQHKQRANAQKAAQQAAHQPGTTPTFPYSTMK